MGKRTIFRRDDEGEWVATPDGNRRRVALHTDELMLVEFAFEAGGEGWKHAHPHVQASYVAEGRFEVVIGEETATLETGDSFIVPSGVNHSVKALTRGRLVDSFAPHRADFL